MIKNISIEFPDAQYSKSSNFKISDVCPHCKNAISPIVIHARAAERRLVSSMNKAAILLQCPFENCNQFFIDWFSIGIDHWEDIESTESIPYVYKPILSNDLPSEVNQKFPEFEVIYSQAILAENYGLDQIAGVGYRKALEFLVKQYAIHKNPDERVVVENEFLGATIATRLSDFPKIQSLAKAATWIGNDETHFVRRHEDKDITSMKKFIKSCATFISADLDADDALEFTTNN